MCKPSAFKHAIRAFLFASDNATIGARRSSGASNNETEEIGSMQEVALSAKRALIRNPIAIERRKKD